MIASKIESLSRRTVESSRYSDLIESSVSSQFHTHSSYSAAGADEKIRTREDSRDEEKDPYDTDLENDDDVGSVTKKAMKFDSSGTELYVGACKMLNQVPVSYYLRQRDKDTMRMRHHSLGVCGTKALCISLVSNTTIETLDLDDNGLECQGCMYIADMLKENYFITELVISNNSIGYKGAMSLFRVIKDSDSLVTLDISGNKIGDRAVGIIGSALVENSKLKNLNLSNNSLDEKTGIELGFILDHNVTLRRLDVSSNNLRMKGMQGLLRGLKKNHGLQYLNLANNGIGLECCADLAKALKEDSSLLELDVSNNRIGLAGILPIAKAFKFNSTLLYLNLARNPFQAAGCMVMVEFLMKTPNWGLRFLSFGTILVTKQFADMQKSLENDRYLLILHGGVMEDWSRQAEIMPQTARQALCFLTDDECVHLAEKLKETATNSGYKASVKDVLNAMNSLGWSAMITREMARRLEIVRKHSLISYDNLLHPMSNT